MKGSESIKKGLKIPRSLGHLGSIPSSGTSYKKSDNSRPIHLLPYRLVRTKKHKKDNLHHEFKEYPLEKTGDRS